MSAPCDLVELCPEGLYCPAGAHVPDAVNTEADTATPDAADAFIARWQGVAASGMFTSQSFLSDLCRMLGVDAPHPTPDAPWPTPWPPAPQRSPSTASPNASPSAARGEARLPKILDMLVAPGRAQERRRPLRQSSGKIWRVAFIPVEAQGCPDRPEGATHRLG